MRGSPRVLGLPIGRGKRQGGDFAGEQQAEGDGDRLDLNCEPGAATQIATKTSSAKVVLRRTENPE